MENVAETGLHLKRNTGFMKIADGVKWQIKPF